MPRRRTPLPRPCGRHRGRRRRGGQGCRRCRRCQCRCCWHCHRCCRRRYGGGEWRRGRGDGRPSLWHAAAVPAELNGANGTTAAIELPAGAPPTATGSPVADAAAVETAQAAAAAGGGDPGDHRGDRCRHRGNGRGGGSRRGQGCRGHGCAGGGYPRNRQQLPVAGVARRRDRGQRPVGAVTSAIGSPACEVTAGCATACPGRFRSTRPAFANRAAGFKDGVGGIRTNPTAGLRVSRVVLEGSGCRR